MIHLPEVCVSDPKPVDLIVLEQDSAHVLSAEWVDRQDGNVSLRLLDPPIPGTSVGISSTELPSWVQGEVTKVDGDVIQIEVRGEMPADRRDYSRTYGGIDLRYQIVPAEEFELAAHRWLTLAESTSDEWFRPDPFMDFSASGVKFHDIERCHSGELLLLEFKVPGSECVHRATAQIIRLSTIPREEMDDEPYEPGAVIPSQTVAAQFLELAPLSIIALIQFSDRIREAAVF